MKKAGIITALVLWVISATRIVKASSFSGCDVVSAFESMKFVQTETRIDARGRYGNSLRDKDERKILVQKFAASIGAGGQGIISEYESDGKNITEYSIDNGKACTDVKLISDDNSGVQYIYMSLTVKDNTECAMTYKSMIEDLWENSGIDGYVSLNLSGAIPGAINYYEKNRIADSLMKKLNADVVTESRDEDIFTIYGYTEEIDDYILMAGERVNVNISESYDEINDETVMYVSTPFNNLDY